MPYKLSETKNGYFVINTETGEKKNKDPLPEENAKKLMAALYANENKKEFSFKELFTDLLAFFKPSETPVAELLPPSEFSVFKDDSGVYRWVLISSNAYRDRDGEIVSTKALQTDVDRADADGDYGPLRWWHVEGLDIGDTEFNMMHGKTLVEMGTFSNPAVAQAVAEKSDELQVSIGFRHPFNEPDSEGVFHNIRRFERSLVPKGRASNPFTSLTVKAGDTDMTTIKEKFQAFKAMLGDDELANHILQQVESKEKALDAAGVAFKADSDTTPDPETLTPKVSADANPGDAATSHKAEDGDPDDKPEKPVDPAAQIGMEWKEMFTEMKALMTEMKAMYSKSKDDEAARKQEQATAMKAYQDKLTALEVQQTATIAALQKSQKEIRELMGELPKNMKAYLASADEDTVLKDDDERLTNKDAQPHSDPLSHFTKEFVFQGTPFAQTN